MATLLHSDSRRLYSWWWDSHISPKHSRWLQENLTDMDAKVKAMIKLIEEDADSFARRAEMYYKKRPELMKLVEEFYRAYRALAERYNHATVELRQAHKTMAEAFPNQEQFLLTDDSPCRSSGPEAEPHTPEMPHPIRAFLEESGNGLSRKGLKQLDEMFGFSQLLGEKQNVKTQNHSESEDAGRAEIDVQTLRKALADMQFDKDSILLQYQKSLENLSEMERELNKAQNVAEGLDERASKAEIEIKIWKEALAELKSEKDAGLVQYNQCLERIASLEAMLSLVHLEAKGRDERATKAATEVKSLKEELAMLEAEKAAALLQYEKSLEKISVLDAKITLAEEKSRMLTEQIERAELEVKALRQNLAELNEEKETATIQYKQCLQKISSMQSEIFHAQEIFQGIGTLTKAYNGVAMLIRQSDPLPPFYQARSMLTLKEAGLAKKVAIGVGAIMMARETDDSHSLSKNYHQNRNNHGGKKGQNRKNNGGNCGGGKSGGGGGRGGCRNGGWQQQPRHTQWPARQWKWPWALPPCPYPSSP